MKLYLHVLCVRSTLHFSRTLPISSLKLPAASNYSLSHTHTHTHTRMYTLPCADCLHIHVCCSPHTHPSLCLFFLQVTISLPKTYILRKDYVPHFAPSTWATMAEPSFVEDMVKKYRQIHDCNCLYTQLLYICTL